MAKPKAKAAPSNATDKILRKSKGLIYGPPHAGKTHLLGTLAQDDRTKPYLHLDFEGGDLTLEGMPGEWDMREIRDWDDYNAVYEELRVNKDGFKSCGVDSLSETHIFALFQILDENGATRKNPDLIEQGDYGTAMVQMRRFVRHFRDLDMHVVFTAGAKDHKDPREGMIKKPSMAGQVADDVPGLMSWVGYMTFLEEEGDDGEVELVRALLLQNYPKVRTKVRTPWGVTAPDEVIEPTMTKVLDAIGY